MRYVEPMSSKKREELEKNIKHSFYKEKYNFKSLKEYLDLDFDRAFSFVRNNLFFKKINNIKIGKEKQFSYKRFLFNYSLVNFKFKLCSYVVNIRKSNLLLKMYNNEYKVLSKKILYLQDKLSNEEIIRLYFKTVNKIEKSSNGFPENENKIALYEGVKIITKIMSSNLENEKIESDIDDILNSISLMKHVENLEYELIYFGNGLERFKEKTILQKANYDLIRFRKVMANNEQYHRYITKNETIENEKILDKFVKNNLYKLFEIKKDKVLDFCLKNQKTFEKIGMQTIQKLANELSIKIDDLLQIKYKNNLSLNVVLKIYTLFISLFYVGKITETPILNMTSCMSKNKFINLLCKTNDVSKTEVDMFYELFTQRFDDLEDIYNKPFLLINDNVLFDIDFLVSVNLPRSFISLVLKENDGTLNNSDREKSMLNNIVSLLNSYDNITCKSNIPIKDKSIKIEGDIDLIFETINYIYVCECKSTLNITDYHNYNRVKSQLDKSFSQLDKIKCFIKHNKSFLSIYGFSTSKKIVYITINTDSSFRGKLFNKYPVIPYKELSLFIMDNIILFNRFFVKEKENNINCLEKYLLCEYFREEKLKFFPFVKKDIINECEFFFYELACNEVIFAKDYIKTGLKVKYYLEKDQTGLAKIHKYNFMSRRFEKYKKFCAKKKIYIVKQWNHFN